MCNYFSNVGWLLSQKNIFIVDENFIEVMPEESQPEMEDVMYLI